MRLPLPAPTDEQQEIIRSVEAGENLLVIAGAGTGKTTSLLHIYRVLLRRHRPEQIVAITFTEKAAGELRDGIRGLLMSEPLLGSQEDALIALSDAPIGTIHSFCARVAREFPDLAGLPTDFVILEAATSAFFEDRALTRFVNDLLSMDPLPDEFLALLESRDYRPASVRDLVGRAFRLLRRKHISTDEIGAIYPDALPGEGSLEGDSAEQGFAAGPGRTALSLTDRFRATYGNWRFVRGYADYEDLLEGAARVLNDRAAAKRLAQAFPAILVDEYQDTDRLQDSIVQTLKSAGSQVILVGDPLQSIYAFRGANVEIFEALVRNPPARGYRVCHLSRNFRSGQPILDFVNLSVRRAEAPEYYARAPLKKRGKPPGAGFPPQRLSESPDYKDLTAGDPSVAGEVVIFPRVKPPDLRRDLAREMEAADLPRQSRWISAQFGIPPGKIAVLFRKFTQVGAYTRALEDAGIPYLAHSGGGLFGTQEVLDIISVLRWIADPADRISEAAVLRSPFCGLDDASLIPWFAPNRTPDTFRQPADGWNRALSVAQRVSQWRVRALAVAPARFVQEVVSDTHYFARLLRLPGGVRRAATLTAFVDRLAQFESQMGWTFREMVEFVTQISREDVSESAPPLDLEDLRTVKLLTVHAAKGLEFDAVILADTLGATAGGRAPYRARAGDSGVLFLEKPTSEEPETARMWNHITVSEARENFRLLYVAMTRAKRVLAINWYFSHDRRNLDPDKPDDFSRTLSLLHGERHQEEGEGDHRLTLRPETRRLVCVTESIPDVEVASPESAVSWEGVDLTARVIAGDGEDRPSASAVTELTSADPAVTDADRRLGKALHEALERWQPAADVPASWNETAEEHGLPEEAARRGRTAVALFARSDVASWLRDFPSDKEVALFGRIEDRWVSGRADLVIYAPGEIRVVDYKLSVSDDDKAAYFAQLRAYAALLGSRSPDTPIAAFIYDLSRGILLPIALKPIQAGGTQM
jgi:ATP-dependent helicase/nuclease subunit A